MGIKFRLKGLCETKLNYVKCPSCKHYEDDGDILEATVKMDAQLTFEGLVVSVVCPNCSNCYVPKGQKIQVITDISTFRKTLFEDKKTFGYGLFWTVEEVEAHCRDRNTTAIPDHVI